MTIVQLKRAVGLAVLLAGVAATPVQAGGWIADASAGCRVVFRSPSPPPSWPPFPARMRSRLQVRRHRTPKARSAGWNSSATGRTSRRSARG
jgi:hypothetical protein